MLFSEGNVIAHVVHVICKISITVDTAISTHLNCFCIKEFIPVHTWVKLLLSVVIIYLSMYPISKLCSIQMLAVLLYNSAIHTSLSL